MRDPLLTGEWNSDKALAVMLVSLAVLLFVALPLEGAPWLPTQARLLTVTCYTVLGVAGVLAVTSTAVQRLVGFGLALIPAVLAWLDAFAPGMGLGKIRSFFGMCAILVLAAVAGALLAHYVGAVTPTRFGLHIMLYVLVWVIVGGTRTFYGPILGVIALSILDEFIREFDEYRPLIYGLILILTVRFLPHGLESLVLRAIAGWRERSPGISRMPAGE